MHKLVLLLIVASVTAIAQDKAGPSEGTSPAAGQTSAKSKKLSRAEFDSLLSSPAEVLVIDVRRPDEHASIGGFPAFLSIQLADLDKYQAFIPKDRKLITVSNHAGRGLKAADLLSSRGFNVAGAIGVQDYEAEGGKLAKFQAPPKREVAATDGKAGQ